jgi:alpha-glucosidase
MSEKKIWWRDAVIYQVYPRSFRDSNGDGEGDLNGVIQGIPYLADLGVDAIWLSPFYKSPNKDGGYDVSDPRDVDPRFGSLVDAKKLIDTAHAHGIKFIADIVPNHFSSEHEWFKAALAAPKGSPERARFHFHDGTGPDGDTPPNNWISIFRGPAWTRVEDGQWYLHLFDSSQPDLNWENPEVEADFEKTLRFWLDLGADGFRIDVAHGCVKDEILIEHRDPNRLIDALRLDFLDITTEERAGLLSDVPFFDREGVHEIYRKWRKIFDSYSGDRMSVAEAFVYPSARAARYVRSDELHQVFNFNFMMLPWDAQIMSESIKTTLEELKDVKAPATWVLNNHDTPRVVTRIGSARKARAIAQLIHALPGGVYIYQGEELGLPSAELPDSARQDPAFIRSGGSDKGRDECRVPLPWDSTKLHYGYSTATPWLPQPTDWAAYCMDSEAKDPASSLNFYKQMLQLRRGNAALGGEGAITWVESDSALIHFTREPGFEVVVNTSSVEKSLDVAGKTILLASHEGVNVKDGRLQLPADTTVWLQR